MVDLRNPLLEKLEGIFKVGKVTRASSGLGEPIKIALDIDTMETKVGWFEGSKYEDGTPVAYVAAIQELGSTHMHPGGTRYVIRNGKAQFVSNSFSGPVHGVTKPHQIVIPPRSFMRKTAVAKKGEWANLAKVVAKRVLNGQMSAEGALIALGQAAEGDIRKTIANLTSPPLRAGTIRSRKRKLADGKKVGNLTKPLVESGYMLTTLTSTVEKK